MAEFGKRGFSAGSLNVIAREAGVAKGSLFQYFEDKLDFFATICESASQAAVHSTLEGLDPGPDEPYFSVVHRVMTRWLNLSRSQPLFRSVALAVNYEMDADARAAVRSVANAHYVDVLLPMAKQAADRGEFRDGTDPAQVVALTVMLLRHLRAAPFYPHIDPILGLYEKAADDVDRIALELVSALERAFTHAA